MRRTTVAPRAGWQAQVESLGLVWHSLDGRPYWDESACYVFTAADVAEIEAASAELYRLYLEAGEHILAAGRLGELGVPRAAWDAVAAAWEAEPPALNFGRFDLGYSGDGPPKLFEFNCDTPTSLLEAAVIQWDWKQAVFPALDQYNGLHDALVAQWRAIAPLLGGSLVHFAHMADAAGEDSVTVAYLRDTAEAAGLVTLPVEMAAIGWDHGAHRFVDGTDRVIETIFHLYPWEWLLAEDFAPMLVESLGTTRWIEPIWKTLWSNKAILPILWELFPGHPNLLEAGARPIGGDQVAKPLFGREGANVSIRWGEQVVAETDGEYYEQGWIYQRFHPLRDFGAGYPVIGAWVVDGVPVGMGIREDGLITGNAARFVPHVIEG
ncbi:glutathionylspermidine synthase family protein [Sphingomonas sp. TDK1]|uniref:glutathionylspermidine synthase family protein n=1 Tax=Sphingomonas sp. TDK1 TaxID=453247 RepID=UPI0007DA3B56|nr:glutathionylspermidine synthase family protein [Sphingomonas sp. TDK1]OAN66154.1 glutathionylspermidine synthase [Sphingomonas sp. TDK1]